MKRFALTIPILALCVWGYTELRPQSATVMVAPTITAADTTRVTMRRVWKVPGGDVMMRMSSVTPDGRYILVGAEDRNQNIRLIDLADRTVREVPEELDVDERSVRASTFPVPSPDGDWLTYSEIVQGPGRRPARLWIVRFDGSGRRALYDGTMGTLWTTDWSPDGTQILGWIYGNGNSIAIVDVETADIRILKSVEWRVPDIPKFSPDGRFVAYGMQPDSTSRQDIFVIAADGSREVAAVENPAQDELLGWTPDGALLFRSDRRGSTDIWALAMEDGRPAGDPVLVVPDVSPARVAGLTSAGDFFYEVRVGQAAMYIANLAAPGSGTVQSARPGGGITRALWSPDGDYLASTGIGSSPGDPTRSKTLTIQATATGARRSVSVAVGRWLSLRSWSRDGRSIIAETMDSRGNLHFARVDVETGALTELMQLEGGQTSYTPVLSPDQNTLYFAHVPWIPGGGPGPQAGYLMARDMATGEERTVFAGPADRPLVWQIDLAPDGTRFAVAYGRRPWLGASNTLAVVTADGDARELVVARADEEFFDPRWTPDGRSIVYLKSYRHGIEELWRVAASGGEPEQIRFPEDLPPIGRLGNFHADGRRFTYVSRSVTEIWVMEDLVGAASEALAEAGQR